MTASTDTIASAVTRLRRRSTLRLMTAAGAVIVAALVAEPAVSADRLPDKDVKALLERINNERDRFEDQLDGKIKNSILRGASGEVNVERFLDDLQENVGRLKERFKSDYSASAEATTVLRQGTDIQRFMSKQPPAFDGASEWNRLASSLGELAKVYGTTFPLPEGQQARRLNDREVEKIASDLAKSAETVQEGSGVRTQDRHDHRPAQQRRRRPGSQRTEGGCGEAGLDTRRWAAGVRRSQGGPRSRSQDTRGRSLVRASPIAHGADRMGCGRYWLTESGDGVRPAGAAPVTPTAIANAVAAPTELDDFEAPRPIEASCCWFLPEPRT